MLYYYCRVISQKLICTDEHTHTRRIHDFIWRRSKNMLFSCQLFPKLVEFSCSSFKKFPLFEKVKFTSLYSCFYCISGKLIIHAGYREVTTSNYSVTAHKIKESHKIETSKTWQKVIKIIQKPKQALSFHIYDDEHSRASLSIWVMPPSLYALL